MKKLFINGKIEIEQVEGIESDIISMLPTKPIDMDGKIHIYLTSEGGEADTAYILTDILNEYKDYIKLIAFREVSSAALYVFMGYEGEKDVVFGTLGVFHIPGISLNTRDIQKKNSLAQHLHNEVVTGHIEKYIDQARNHNFPESFIKKALQGMDNILSYKQLLEIAKEGKIK